MLSANELAALRLVAVQALPDTATIQRRSLTSDNQLGQTETWSTIASAVPCRLTEDHDGRGDVTVGARAASTGEMLLRLPHGTSIQESDRVQITINSRVRTVEVSRIVERSFATTLTAIVTEVR